MACWASSYLPARLPVSRLRFTSFSFSRRSAPVWPPSAAGATRARRRRSADRSSSSRSTRCAPITCRPTATRKVQDAGDRRARRRRRRLRARLFARAADAAGARGDPVGTAAVRDRRARQRRLHREDRRAAAAADAARARLHDRRRRVGVRAAQGDRHRPGLRFLRRRDAAELARAVDRPGAARRRASRSRSPSTGSTRSAPRARSCSCTSTSRTSRTRRRSGSPSTRRTTARSPTPTKSSAAWCSYLKSHQLYDRSTIVLLSDHGEGLGDHGEQEHGLFVYDEAIHVPLIIKQEGNAGAGRRVADLVQHIDLVPTILDLVKAPGAGSLRGRSLKPLLDGTGTLRDAGGLLRGALRALSLRLERADRADRRALPLHQGAARGAVRPRARSARADQHRRRSAAARARRCAARSIASPPARRFSAPAEVSADARERLQALGYVGAQTDVVDRRPATRCPIRRTSARSSSATAPRSTSPASGSGRRRSRCCSRSCATIRRWPTSGASSRCSRRGSIATIWRSTPTSTTSR